MKHLKTIALLFAVVLLGFSACKKDDDPLAVEYSSVELSADNTIVTVTFNQGVYRNADKTGSLDANNFMLSFTAADTVTASYTAQHTAGESKVLITFTYEDEPQTGDKLSVTAKANTIYGIEGNALGQDLEETLDVN